MAEIGGRGMKAVMLSIRPEWCEKIAQGRKTIELRKSKPKLELPFKCYIYCTYGKGLIERYDSIYPNVLLDEKVDSKHIWGNCCNGKVIGEFVCDAILSHCEMANADIAEQMSCVRRKKIREYSGGKEVFGWHISDLEIYDTPKELCEFWVECNELCEACGLWKATRVNADEIDMDCTSPVYAHKPLTRPPQSWCYVEELT